MKAIWDTLRRKPKNRGCAVDTRSEGGVGDDQDDEG